MYGPVHCSVVVVVSAGHMVTSDSFAEIYVLSGKHLECIEGAYQATAIPKQCASEKRNDPEQNGGHGFTAAGT